MNFLTETMLEIDGRKSKGVEVTYIGSNDVELTLEQFKQLANVEYNTKCSCEEMPHDIRIEFSDGSMIIRAEFDFNFYWKDVEPYVKGRPVKISPKKTFKNWWGEALGSRL